MTFHVFRYLFYTLNKTHLNRTRSMSLKPLCLSFLSKFPSRYTGSTNAKAPTTKLPTFFCDFLPYYFTEYLLAKMLKKQKP